MPSNLWLLRRVWGRVCGQSFTGLREQITLGVGFLEHVDGLAERGVVGKRPTPRERVTHCEVRHPIVELTTDPTACAVVQLTVDRHAFRLQTVVQLIDPRRL